MFFILFEGVGIGQLLGSICVATYYCSLMALTIFYMIKSFTPDLPWAECDPEWEIENNLKNITCIASKAKGDVLKEGETMSSSELYFV